MQTKQPKWKAIGHVGDIDPISYGGGFVYEDSTGVYCPEIAYFEPATDETWHKLEGNSPVSVYRILIERDPTREWWYEKLADVATYCGQPLETMQALAGGTTMERAYVYESLIHYFGAEEFDYYPTQTIEGKANFRYWRELKNARHNSFAA